MNLIINAAACLISSLYAFVFLYVVRWVVYPHEINRPHWYKRYKRWQKGYLRHYWRWFWSLPVVHVAVGLFGGYLFYRLLWWLEIHNLNNY